jgi:hypothetical protein
MKTKARLFLFFIVVCVSYAYTPKKSGYNVTEVGVSKDMDTSQMDSFCILTHVYSNLPRNSRYSNLDTVEHIFEVVGENYPEFPGGGDAFDSFLYANINWPLVYVKEDAAVRDRTMVVSVVVHKDSSLSNFKVLRGVDPELDNEIIRVFELSPSWIPGNIHGRLINVRHTFSILFSCD